MINHPIRERTALLRQQMLKGHESKAHVIKTRFHEGRPDLVMRRRNLTFKRGRYQRFQKWAT